MKGHARKLIVAAIAPVFLLGITATPAIAHEALSNEDGLTRFVVNLFSADNSPAYLVIIFLITFVLGAVHALMPGHGKTVVSAYMVGTRGTVGDAITLGVTVTVTHLSSVIILGVALAFASRYVVPEKVMPMLGTASGLIILALGLWMLYRRLRNRGVQFHSHHDHDHAHRHPHPERGWGRLSLISLGVSGGMVPCYDAIVVLLLAFSLNRIALGLSLITVFSLGLAFVLIFLAILFAKSSSLLEKHLGENRLVRHIPVVSAVAITVLGIILTGKSFSQI